MALTALCIHAAELPRGQIIEKVACTKAPDQTYALYVPSNYDAGRAWPAIFCFDPGARGLVPVQRLRAAAEKYGYLLIGSNNSRNGPWDANFTAINAVVADVTTFFKIDANRTYAAGLSGGARLAMKLGLVGFAKGVIACSAGFPESDDGIPGKVPFAIFGTAGTEDFNYTELKRLDGLLDDRGAAHRIVIFEGGHEWASEVLLTKGVEWLELQAMRTGKRPRDEAFIQAQLQAGIAAAAVAPLPEAWRLAKALATDFAGLVDVREFEKKAKELVTTREVKDWQKTERAALKREDDLSAELGELATSGSESRTRKKVAEVRRMAEAPEDSAERRMGRRVVAGVAASSREMVRDLFDRHEYELAARTLALLAELRPGQSRTLYDLARARGLDGNRKGALDALQLAATAGFSDGARAEADPAFQRMKKDPSFQKILETMRANPPEPDRPSRGRP